MTTSFLVSLISRWQDYKIVRKYTCKIGWLADNIISFTYRQKNIFSFQKSMHFMRDLRKEKIYQWNLTGWLIVVFVHFPKELFDETIKKGCSISFTLPDCKISTINHLSLLWMMPLYRSLFPLYQHFHCLELRQHI